MKASDRDKSSGNRLRVRDQQSESTRKMILQAALNLFAERGFDGAVLRDIADEVGVNHAMVKYHFENKENLWREAVRFLFARLSEEAAISEDEAAGKSTLGMTKLFIRKYIHYCARHPEHARLMVQVSVRDNKRLTWAVKEFIAELHETFMQHIALGERENVWPQGVPPVYLLYITVAVCQNIFMLAPELKKIHGISMKSKQAIDEYADTVIALFFDHCASDNT